MRHRASPKFWQFSNRLSAEVQRLADENYQFLEQDSSHPSLHFEKVGKFWSVRVGIHHRALAVEDGADVVGFWIGRHDEYERLIGRRR